MDMEIELRLRCLEAAACIIGQVLADDERDISLSGTSAKTTALAASFVNWVNLARESTE